MLSSLLHSPGHRSTQPLSQPGSFTPPAVSHNSQYSPAPESFSCCVDHPLAGAVFCRAQKIDELTGERNRVRLFAVTRAVLIWLSRKQSSRTIHFAFFATFLLTIALSGCNRIANASRNSSCSRSEAFPRNPPPPAPTTTP